VFGPEGIVEFFDDFWNDVERAIVFLDFSKNKNKISYLKMFEEENILSPCFYRDSSRAVVKGEAGVSFVFFDVLFYNWREDVNA